MKIIRFNIDVEFSTSIYSSKIPPIYKDDGSIDQAAFAEYEEFIINVFSILDEVGYDVIEEHESSKSKISYYLSSYKKSESNKSDIKCIIFIRISDHQLREASKKSRTNYYKQLADDMKQPKYKSKQVWRFKNIVVNGDTFESYEDALEFLKQKLSN